MFLTRSTNRAIVPVLWSNPVQASRSSAFGRERTIRFRAPERGKRTFLVTRRAAAPDPKRIFSFRPFRIASRSAVAYGSKMESALGDKSEQPSPTEVELSAADLAALQGAWEQVYLEVDGVANPSDEHTAPGALTTISGKRFSVRRSDEAVLLEGVFELNAATSPKSITWTDSIGLDAGKRLPASYMLEQDRFTFIAANQDSPRPLAFRTSAGLTMREFIRRLVG